MILHGHTQYDASSDRAVPQSCHTVHTSYLVYKEMGHEVRGHLFQAMTCSAWTVMSSLGGGVGLILGLLKKCCAVSPGFISYSYVMEITFF